MTIETQGLLFPVMFCDGVGCDEEISHEDADSFQALVNHAKNNGWQITKDRGDWVHYCPQCRK
jgi:hypothetical protein